MLHRILLACIVGIASIMAGITIGLLVLGSYADEIGRDNRIPGMFAEFVVARSDERLYFTASNLPEGSMFDPWSATFRWKAETVGIYSRVKFEVSDGELFDTEEIVITVHPLE